ncbi:MAG: hypothetical protein M0013_06880 [Actinomycetota bacterium]|nr:hypothetical protein [Actinomycetota bacterium]
MNVVLTLTPACSALAMYWLLQRWATWRPAAFIGGLLYGFSPFMLTVLALNQLNLAFLAIPPLMVGVLDDILVRQQIGARRSGMALAALVVVQFFVGIELLAIVAVCVLVGMALVVAGSARRPAAARARLSHALRSLAWATGASVLVLAVPVWYFAAGPAHLSGPIWGTGPLSTFGTGLVSTVEPGGLAALESVMHRLGGYQGSGLPGFAYLGWTWVAAIVAGMVWRRRDRLLWLFGAVGVMSALLALAPSQVGWAPWRALRHVPLLSQVVEVRFAAVTTLCASVLAGLVVDHVHRAFVSPKGRIAASRPTAAAACAISLAAVVAVPPAVAMASNVPLVTRPVAPPPWFAGPGRNPVPGRVVLTYPVPSSGLQASQAWQAIAGMPFSMAGAGGPAGTPAHAGDQAAAVRLLDHASLPLGPAPVPTTPVAKTLRGAIHAWGVTTVIVPDQRKLAPYDRGRSTSYAVGLFTAVIGSPPQRSAGAWVWSLAEVNAPAVPESPMTFTRCTAGVPAADVAACVLGRG